MSHSTKPPAKPVLYFKAVKNGDEFGYADYTKESALLTATKELGALDHFYQYFPKAIDYTTWPEQQAQKEAYLAAQDSKAGAK